MRGMQKIPDGTVAHDPTTNAAYVYRGNQPVPAVMDGSGRYVPSAADPTAAPVSAGNPTDQKDLSDFASAGAQSLRAATEAQHFKALNQTQDTCGWNGVGLPWNGGNIGDIRAMSNVPIAKMRAITNRVAPNLRPAGSGSSSDRDTSVYISGFPNISAPKGANDANEADWHAKSDHDAARTAFADTWFAKRGTLLGMSGAFNKFWADRQASGKSVYTDDAPAPRPMARPTPQASAPASNGWGIQKVN